MPIARIVSGGQTGADRGGLEVAIYCDIPHGGWCPKGRKAEDGVIPVRYNLQETNTDNYLERTELNVRDSDATVVFTLGTPSGGSLKTISLALDYKKPWYYIDVNLEDRQRAVKQITFWLRGEIGYDYENYTAKPPENCILNVAGSRESMADGIQDLVMAIMIDVLIEVNPGCKQYYPVR